ncbi:uncharacterized protein CLAFUR5_05959 [Fulvia fulva]|uniref:Uncharacterized protein n=1 Tax=Passalora fulva TaxID=5499 RepID=A0A9Q8LI28_PASFU|nr:uncharacterized protein CLAFUR5_05959 [Fulvia fulva]KAK4624778.1 hypothetical protein CLAFUR0_05823 [Fulvia fulva]UJO17793.1 hypothetical protein CLAFUR5_05959 [Fulvia fulva]
MSFYTCYAPGCPRRQQSHARLTNPCTGYCCSKFLNYHDEPLTQGDTSNVVPLNNPIHPLFHKSKFHRDIDYTLLETPLRLASLLLESPGALEYINTIAGGELYERRERKELGAFKRFWHKTTWGHVDAEGGSGGKISWSPIRKASKAQHVNGNALFQGVAKDVLQRLSRAVTEFRLSDPTTRGYNTKGETSASCEPDYRPMTARTVTAFPRGGTTTIIISRDKYTSLLNLRKRLRRGNFLSPSSHRHALRLAQFLIANAIVHEIGHSLCTLCCGWRPQLFHNEHPIGEAGFDLEYSIYDGVMGAMIAKFWTRCESYRQRDEECDVDMSVAQGLVLQEWPSWMMAGLYRYTGCSLSVLDECWEPFNQIDYRIPSRWLERLFDQVFWDVTVPRVGKKALHPPKVAAWVFALAKDKNGAPIKMACDVQHMVRPGFMADEHRRVLAEAMNIRIPAVRDDVVLAGPSNRIDGRVVASGVELRTCCGAGCR